MPVYTTAEIYLKALRLLNHSGYPKPARNLAVSVYDLLPGTAEQLELFSSPSHAVAGSGVRLGLNGGRDHTAVWGVIGSNDNRLAPQEGICLLFNLRKAGIEINVHNCWGIVI